ncbi:MAG: hypothetical protein AAFX56_00765 [Pseudomonadota bacterium]
MLKIIMCGISILLGLALFLADSLTAGGALTSYVGAALVGLGLFSLGGGSPDIESGDGADEISPADRVRRLRNG